jgi:hypothetical protein
VSTEPFISVAKEQRLARSIVSFETYDPIPVVLAAGPGVATSAATPGPVPPGLDRHGKDLPRRPPACGHRRDRAGGERLRETVIYVTHNVAEAVYPADWIVILTPR